MPSDRLTPGKALVLGTAIKGTIRMAEAVHDDIENGTSRNSVEAGAEIGGGFGGAAGGSYAGAAIGTAFLPGLGTAIGGLAGGIIGGFGGSYGAQKVTEKICDEADYDIEYRWCRNCGREFVVRLYKGEDRRNRYCRRCR